MVAVNDAGVHLNAAAAHAHRQPMLALVCGLGPVKAHSLVARIRKLKNSKVCARAAAKRVSLVQPVSAGAFRPAWVRFPLLFFLSPRRCLCF